MTSSTEKDTNVLNLSVTPPTSTNSYGYNSYGYNCQLCGTWVSNGMIHYCAGYNPNYKPLPYPTVHPYYVDLTPLVYKLDEIMKELKEIKKELAKKR